MENFFNKALEQAPALVIFCGIVYFLVTKFLEAFKTHAIIQQTLFKKYDDTVKEGQVIIDKNNNVIGANNELLRKFNKELIKE